MDTTLEFVILIDDNEDDNFINRHHLNKSGMVGEVRDFVRAREALDFLRTPNRPSVDLILLDINMPGMDGFQFADEYEKLYPELKASTLMIMVSASLNPDDEKRAESHPAIDGFIGKPPETNKLKQLIGSRVAKS